MPVVLLQYQERRGLKKLATELTGVLPSIIAPNLTIENRDRDDGSVIADDIIVRCTPSPWIHVNSKEIEIIIFAHDFPERKVNLEERKEAILKGVREFIASEDYKGVTGFVWVMLVPTAFGHL